VQLRRLAEHQPARGGRAAGVEPQPGQQVKQRAGRGRGLRGRQLRAGAEVRPAGEAQIVLRARPAGLELVRATEHRRVPVRPGDRHPDQITAPDKGPGQLRIGGGVPVDHGRGRLQPQRLGHRGGQQGPVRRHPGQRRRVAQQVQHRVADHALGGLDAAEHQHGRVRRHLVRRKPALRRRGREQRGAARRADRSRNPFAELRERRPPGLHLIDVPLIGIYRDRRDIDRRGTGAGARRQGCYRRDDRVVPGQDLRRVGVRQAEQPGHHRYRERPGQPPPQLRRPAVARLPRRLQFVHQGVRSLRGE
jgi:hypothetical protein